jgi:hypothetical protein
MISTSCIGWPGIRCAAGTLLMCLTLGPGAILVGVFGHQVVAHHDANPTAGIGSIVDLVGRSLAVLIGSLFSAYALTLLKTWLTTFSIAIDDHHLTYRTACLGHRHTCSIAYLEITEAAPFLDMGTECRGYVRVSLHHDAQIQDMRMVTSSYAIAEQIADQIRVRLGRTAK